MMSFFSRLFSTETQPDNKNTFTVDSFTGRDQYRIDVNSIKCTCPDFLDRRSSFQKSDPRRLCKHLVQVLLNTGQIPDEMEKYSEQIQRCGDYRRGFSLDNIHQAIIAGVTMDISFPKDSTWVNVYLDGTRYGYNHEEMRWSYGNLPEKSREIEAWIMDKVGKQLPEPVPEGAIKTISKIYVDDRNYVVTGLVNETAISVLVNPRARWMPYTIDQEHEGTLNVKTLDNKCPGKYGHLDLDLKRWIPEQLASK